MPRIAGTGHQRRAMKMPQGNGLILAVLRSPAHRLASAVSVLGLALPGYAAGALLTFIRVIDDLGTPLMLNYTRLLAPQAYVRVTTIGLTVQGLETQVASATIPIFITCASICPKPATMVVRPAPSGISRTCSSRTSS